MKTLLKRKCIQNNLKPIKETHKYLDSILLTMYTEECCHFKCLKMAYTLTSMPIEAARNPVSSERVIAQTKITVFIFCFLK